MKQLLVMFLAVTAAFTPAIADNTELRIATLAPAGSKWVQVLESGAKDVETGTAGRMKFKFFEGGSQGDEKDFIRKIKAGQLDGAAVTAVGLGLIDESIRVLELPQMFATVEEFDYVAEKMWPYFQGKFKKAGFVLAGRGDVGWIHLVSKNKIETLADLKAQKPWVWGDDQLVSAMFTQLGVNGVQLGVPEVDAALTAGRINVAYGSPLAIVALQWYSKCKYLIGTPQSFGVAATVFSNAALEKASTDDMALLVKSQKANGKQLRKAIRKENDSALKTMTRKGITVVEMPDASKAEMRNAAEAVWKSLTGKVYSQAELDMVIKHRDEYRAKKK